MAELLAPAYSARRRALIDGRAADDPQPGTPGDRKSWIPWPEQQPSSPDDPDWLVQLHSGVPTVGPAARRTGAGNTCTVAAVDSTGTMVVAVPSGGWLKSSPVVPGLGFPLGTRAQTTWLDKGHRIDAVPAHSLGKVCAVGVDPVHGFLRAAAGPRGRQAYAVCR